MFDVFVSGEKSGTTRIDACPPGHARAGGRVERFLPVTCGLPSRDWRCITKTPTSYPDNSRFRGYFLVTQGMKSFNSLPKHAEEVSSDVSTSSARITMLLKPPCLISLIRGKLSPLRPSQPVAATTQNHARIVLLVSV